MSKVSTQPLIEEAERKLQEFHRLMESVASLQATHPRHRRPCATTLSGYGSSLHRDEPQWHELKRFICGYSLFGKI